jgi:ubiquinone/menaquinone biosynthesis C-methylase UbiE
MPLTHTLRWSARKLLGHGWMYRVPRYYESTIDVIFGATRRAAFHDLLHGPFPVGSATAVVDLACGTGITSTWLATHLPRARIIGLDASPRMLNAARRRAAKLGLSDRCVFLQRDATTVSLNDLPVDRPVDLVVCSLGYSVFPDWKAVFANTMKLLSPAGVHVVFDQYIEHLYVPDFAADQTRRTWELVEEAFERADTRWYGDCFLAVGAHPRRPAEDPPAHLR